MFIETVCFILKFNFRTPCMPLHIISKHIYWLFHSTRSWNYYIFETVVTSKYNTTNNFPQTFQKLTNFKVYILNLFAVLYTHHTHLWNPIDVIFTWNSYGTAHLWPVLWDWICAVQHSTTLREKVSATQNSSACVLGEL